MLRLLADENLDRRIVRGLRLALPDLDCGIAQDEGLTGVADRDVLAWAAAQNRVLVTHDVNTIPHFAYERMSAGEGMAGVVIVPKDLAIGREIEDLSLVVECSTPADLDRQVLYLPL